MLPLGKSSWQEAGGLNPAVIPEMSGLERAGCHGSGARSLATGMWSAGGASGGQPESCVPAGGRM